MKQLTWSAAQAFLGTARNAGSFCVDVARLGRMVRGELAKEPSRITTYADRHVLSDLLRRCPGVLAVDIETAPASPDRGWTGKDPTQARLKTIGFGTEDEGCSVWWATADQATKDFIACILLDPNVLKVFHNGWWFDIRVLAREGMPVVNVADTRDWRRATSSTSPLALRYLGSIFTDVQNWKEDKDDDGEKLWETDKPEKLMRYNALDCVITARAHSGILRDYAAGDWEERRAIGELYNVHTELAKLTARMHDHGVFVCSEQRAFMAMAVDQAIEEKREALLAAVGIDGFEATPNNMRALIFKRHETSTVRRFGLPDPVNKKQYTSETLETISVDEKSLLLLMVSGGCPEELLPIIEAWWEYQGETKRRGYLKSEHFDHAIGPDGRVRPGWNSCGTDTGRWACSSPNLMNIEQVLRNVVGPPPGRAFCHADKCVAPDTKVLRADLTWVRADAVSPGDELVGFDEHLGPTCRMRGAIVTGAKPVKEPALTIHTSKGPVTCSTLHRWPVKRKQRKGGEPVFQWVEAQHVLPGDEIRWFVEPWETDTSYEGAYLAGIYDGEGCVSRGSVQFTQNDGPIMDHVETLLRAKGFRAHRRAMKTTSKTAHQLNHTGQRGGLRFVGAIRPRRLLAKSRQMWEGTRPWGRLTETALVTRVEGVGVIPLLALQTSTGTFIANGFMSHNSQLELRVMACVAEDMVLQKALDTGDVYSFDAMDWFELPVGTDVKKTHGGLRKSAKIIHLGRQYGAGLKTVFGQALRQDRRFTLERTRLLMKKWDATYQRTKAYWAEEMRRVQKTGYSFSRLIGRRRGYPAPPELSEVANYPIQSTAADLMNYEILELDKRLTAEVPGAFICIQLHDAVDVECDEGDVAKVERIIDEVMSREWTVNGLTAPFPIERKTVAWPETWAAV